MGFPCQLYNGRNQLVCRLTWKYLWTFYLQKKNNTGDSSEYRELNNGAPHQNPNDIISTYLNGTLIISRVGREHEGSFLCQASNGIGAGLSTLIKLTVHGK